MEDILLQIQSVLDTYVKTPRGIKAVFYGESSHITNMDFPCIVISPASTEVVIETNIQDTDTFVVQVSVLTDAKKTMGKDATNHRVNKELLNCMKIMEEREDSSMAIKENTVVGALRKHFYRKSPYTLKNDIRVSYPTNTNPQYPTFEGILEVTFTSQLYNRE